MALPWKRLASTNTCFTSMLSAISTLASLEHGKMVHCHAVKDGFCFNTSILGNAILDMYFKCGSLQMLSLSLTQCGVLDSYGCWVWVAWGGRKSCSML